jgi:hypothetical protein
MTECAICGEFTFGFKYCKSCWEKLANENSEWINADGEGKRSRKNGDY